MNLITLDNVSKQYSERVLLDGVNLQINQADKIGLIGLNGSGKTTLLQLIAQQESPDEGQVIVQSGVRVQYLGQEPVLDDSLTVLAQLFDSAEPEIVRLRDYETAVQHLQANPDDADCQQRLTLLTDEMNRTNGWEVEARVKASLTRLGITNFEQPIAALSGGQRKRVALARALITPVDLLILDEPTNHIDAETVAWLEDYLAGMSGALLMVTHDRYFLDRVVNRIVDLDRRQLISYLGTYSDYLDLSAKRHQQLLVAEENRQRLLKRELEWLRKGPKARGTKQKARQQRVAELQTLDYDSRRDQVAINLAGRRLGKQVLRVENLRVCFDEQTLFQQVNLTLKPQERIGIIGPNGAGKSTLLNVLAGRLAADSGQVSWGETVHLGYYDQHSRNLDLKQTVIGFIEQEAPLIQAEDGTRMTAFQVLEWFLFPKKQQYAQIGSLSGGERRRLYLLYVLMQRPNVLLLDEPTNDLDIQTLTVLEEFLDHFRGSLIVVSHDRYFLDRTVDFLLNFEDGRLSQPYPTPYSTYQRLRADEQASGQQAESSSKSAADKPAIATRPRRLRWKEARELEQLDQRVEALEAEKVRLQGEINRVGGDYQALQTFSEKLATVEHDLEMVTERWLELTELAEG